jgi:hypothetical protein
MRSPYSLRDGLRGAPKLMTGFPSSSELASASAMVLITNRTIDSAASMAALFSFSKWF